jgi:hypothetical protein
MHRRVVFALAALPLSGSLVAYGPDAAPLAKALTGAPGTRMTGGTALRANTAGGCAGSNPVAPISPSQHYGVSASAPTARRDSARTRW